jgi:hypothetical protein
VNVRRIAAQHNDAIGEKHRFFDVVSNHKDGASGNLFAQPEF